MNGLKHTLSAYQELLVEVARSVDWRRQCIKTGCPVWIHLENMAPHTDLAGDCVRLLVGIGNREL